MSWWKREPSKAYKEALAAYQEAMLAMKFHTQNLEAQNRDLQNKLLELLEPGITARLAPRPVRLVPPKDEVAAAIEKLRPRLVSLPGYEESEES